MGGRKKEEEKQQPLEPVAIVHGDSDEELEYYGEAGPGKALALRKGKAKSRNNKPRSRRTTPARAEEDDVYDNLDDDQYHMRESREHHGSNNGIGRYRKGPLESLYVSATTFYSTRLCSMIYLMFFAANAAALHLSYHDGLILFPCSVVVLYHLKIVGLFKVVASMCLVYPLIVPHDETAYLVLLSHMLYFMIVSLLTWE